jgi:putative phosphoribosyl transferase
MPFLDRVEAGRQLGRRLSFLRGEDVVVLGVPRGGVPVAFEVSRLLDAPLDVILVGKLGVPSRPELAVGAIGEAGVRAINNRAVDLTGVSHEQLELVERIERAELDRRADRYRRGHRPVSLTNRTAVVVDDGAATGSTARAACQVARARGADRVIVALPVASPDAIVAIGGEAEVICLESPHDFRAVGCWYKDLGQTSDDDVGRLLEEAHESLASARPDR